MFSKSYDIEPKHINFQGVLDRNHYPIYFEWCRLDYFYLEMGIDSDQLFEQGKQYVVVEYTLRFKKDVYHDEPIIVTCERRDESDDDMLEIGEKMFVDGVIAAEGTFLCACVYHNQQVFPEILKDMHFK